MSKAIYDLLITGGRVVDPSQDLDDERDIALSDGRLAALERSVPESSAQRVVKAHGLIVTPGLIDFHVHVYEGVSHYGVNADSHCLSRGVTTVVDAGSAGAETFPGLLEYIVRPARTRILAYLNISALGMIGRSVGELEDLRYVDVDAALDVIEENRDVILGIKARMEPEVHGDNGYAVLGLAREASEAARVPLMFHIGDTHPPLPQILETSQPGDVITHCYHSRPGGILDARGRLLPEVVDAAARGVVFDVGHGRGSFSFEVARRALDQGLEPDTISTDLHSYNVGGPVHDLVTTMSKFLHLGLPLSDVIYRSSTRPAEMIGMGDRLGTLRPGALADVTLLELRQAPVQLSDAGWNVPVETITADQFLAPVGVIRDGELSFLTKSDSPPQH
jgi:dihydroorotase